MCFGGGGGGGGGETDAQKHSREASQEQFDWQKKTYEDDIARQQADAAKQAAIEAERQKRVEDGLALVDKTFKGVDPETKQGRKYYRGLSKDYVSQYLPTVNKQYDQAGQENLFSFARNGTVDSSAAAKASADLAGQLGEQKQALALQGEDYSNTAKTNAENRRNALVNQVYATADPVTVSAAGVAAGQKATNFTDNPAQFILPKNNYSPLAGLFTTASTIASNAITQGASSGQGLGSLFAKRTNEGKNYVS